MRTRPVGPQATRSLLEYKKFSIAVLQGPDKGQSADFEQRSVEIGTDASCAFRLTDRTVSRHHCVVEITEEGYCLRDLGSRNGTWIAGCRIGWAVLAPGVTLSVGSTAMRLDVADTKCRVELSRTDRFGRLIGKSAAMRELFAVLQKVARGDATVLLEGESGSGKELAAEAIHTASPRAGRPLEVFDCASVPENLVESELFGHERGAFTGANARHAGSFERASGGTLLLDEIGELPESLQPKLLRVLDSRELRPVGGSRPIKIDVRVVAATNRDLAQMVSEGKFRLDLFHRLAVVRARLPPLRHRPDDIPLLVDGFLQECRAEGREPPPLSQEALARLQAYSWPGNVRELRNFVERGVQLEQDFAEVPFLETGTVSLGGPVGSAPAEQTAALFPSQQALPPYHAAKARLVDEWEREYCRRLLEAHEGNVSGAAREAGMNRKSLEYLLSKHGIRSYRR